MKVSLPWWLVLVLVALAGGAVWFGLWQRSVRVAAEAQAKHEAEGKKLAEAGLQTAQADLDKNAQELAELRRALAAIHIPSTPAVVVHGTTGPLHVGGAGLESPLPPSGAVQAPAADGTSAAAGCLLTEKDQTEIRVSGGAVKTDAGNYVVEGKADAYALGPERHLFGGPLKLDVHIPPSAVPPATKQGIGLGGALSFADRFRVGLAVAPPAFDALWGTVRIETSLTLQCDPNTAKNGCRDNQNHSTLMLGGQIIGRLK